MQIFFVKNVGRIEKSLSLQCRGRKKSLKILVLFQPNKYLYVENKNNNHKNKQTMKHAERFTKKELEDIIQIEEMIEEEKESDELIYLSKPSEARTLWEIQDQNGYPSDAFLINLGNIEEPDICVEICGGDEYSSVITARYSINGWTAEDMYVDFMNVMNRWKKEKFVADEYGRYHHHKMFNGTVPSDIINKVINN